MPEWTLYGQKLDLEEFKKYHPGGSLAVLLGEERDCTRLFEQYHCRNASNQTVLKQLATQQGKEINPAIQDPFQQEVLQMAYDHKGGYTASQPKLVFLCILGLVLITTWIGWTSGSWIACLLLPFLSWLFMVNVSHDSAHFAFSDTPWLNELFAVLSVPLGFNTTLWYIEHNVAHHVHTNEPTLDIDINVPLTRSHIQRPVFSKNPLIVTMGIITTFMLSIIIQTIIGPILLLCKNKDMTDAFGNYDSILKFCTPKIILQFIITGLFIGIPFFLFKWPKALCFVFFPYIITSVIFMTVSQVSHIQEETQPAVPNANWMRQMVESSMDYSQDSAFWSLMTGGLNIQSLHHCVPAIDSSHFMELYPKFRVICEKHGVKINEVPTLWDAIKKYWSHIHNLSKEPKGEGCPYTH